MKRALLIALIIPRAVWATGILNALLGASIATLLASASPSSITDNQPAASFTSSAATCAGQGGIPPYTYAWTWASGGSSISINSASSASTTFTVSAAALNTTYSGVAQCTATDTRSVTSPDSGGVSVSMSRIPLFPPSLNGTATLVAATTMMGGMTFVGYSTSLSIGTLTPSTDFNSNTVEDIYCNTTSGQLILGVTQPASVPTYINDLVVNGTTFATSSAGYTYMGGIGSWTWSSISCPVTSGMSYPAYYY